MKQYIIGWTNATTGKVSYGITSDTEGEIHIRYLPDGHLAQVGMNRWYALPMEYYYGCY